MVVYADVIFLNNLLIDGAVLMTTAWTRRVRAAWWRIGAAALIGASYVAMMFLPETKFLFTFAVKCIFSIVMIMTAFGFGSLQHFLRNMGAFYVVNFAAAGGIFGAHYFFQSADEIFQGIWFTQTGSLQVGVPFILIVFGCAVALFRSVHRSGREKEQLTVFLAEITIVMDTYETKCTGLIDTGNQLYDPLTRTPVMVMEVLFWKDVLPEAWVKRIQQSDVEQIVTAMGKEDFAWQDRLRLIPYRGVNRGTQFMLALKPDKVVIAYDGKQVEATKVLIGLDGGKLSSEGAYQAIIHPALVE